jgi:UDP-N-acetylglucosamine 2-epimerase (non-hydrolysing)
VKRPHVLHAVGARPNFMKIAPILAAAGRSAHLRSTLVHTGQHYDERMARLLFTELGIPRPDVDLEVGSASHAQQTALILARFEPILLEQRPDLVLVVGDVNSTLACSLCAVKLGIPVAHVEAGLRSFDRTMPEEINRLMTDAVSDLLFVSEPSGLENLQREGVADDKVHFVGNVMIDTLLAHRQRAEATDALSRHGLEHQRYAVLTLHRPSNVDDPETLVRIFAPILDLARQMPVLFPVHPRTRERLERSGLAGKGLRIVEPLGYLDFLKLMVHARLVLTDSGGIQEETTVLGVPCITLRENTERPVTVTHGTNVLAGTDPARIRAAITSALDAPRIPTEPPPKWDGHAAERIVEVLAGISEAAGPWGSRGSPTRSR